MTFTQSIATVFGKYAEFRGVASRPEFWWWILFTALVNAGLTSLMVWTTAAEGAYPVGPNLTGFWAIAVILPTLAVSVRRLRAAGYSWGEPVLASAAGRGAHRSHRPVCAAGSGPGAGAADRGAHPPVTVPAMGEITPQRGAMM